MSILDTITGFFGAGEAERPEKEKKFLSDDLEALFEDPDMDRLRAEAEGNTAGFTERLRRTYR